MRSLISEVTDVDIAVIDNVPLTNEHEMNQTLASTLEGILFEAVIKGGDSWGIQNS